MNPSDDPQNPYAAPTATPISPPAAANWGVAQDTLGEDSNPWLTIWIHPRLTIDHIVGTHPTLHVTLLACLIGIVDSVSRAADRSHGNQMQIGPIIAIILVVGPLGGLFSVWLWSHLLKVSGSWIGGRASRTHLKAAITWGAIPVVATLPLWVIKLLLVGNEVFRYETPNLDAQPLLLVTFFGISIIELALVVWGLVLMCNTVAEVQEYRSAWKGLANLVLGLSLIVVPIMLMVFAVIGVS